MFFHSEWNSSIACPTPSGFSHLARSLFFSNSPFVCSICQLRIVIYVKNTATFCLWFFDNIDSDGESVDRSQSIWRLRFNQMDMR